MNLYFTENFEKRITKICHKQTQLKRELAKQFKLFQQNPSHPSLKLHKLQGKRSTQYAIWIKGDLRALYIIENGQYIFFDLVTHDQY